jgi:hypothetical protein
VAEDTRNPTSDENVTGTWTGTAGSRWQVVDDYPDSTGADFITCSANGVITFGFSAFNVPAGSTGITVFVDYYDIKNGGGASAAGARLKCGASYFNASTHNPSNGTWVQRTDTFANNPATAAAWTVDQVNGVGANALTAFGLNVSDASPSVGLSSIRVRVQYTPPAQNFDSAVTAATFTALAPMFEAGNTNFDVTAPVATFSALTPTFEAVAVFDTSVPSGTFVGLDVTFETVSGLQFDTTAPTLSAVALDPTFLGIANFDVAPPLGTFGALAPTFEAGNANFDVTAPVASFTALDVVFTVASPQDFNVSIATLSASALPVTFEQPSPPGPTRAHGGMGGGGVFFPERREYEERLLETLERIDARLEQLEDPKRDKRNRFLIGGATLLVGIIAKKMNQ